MRKLPLVLGLPLMVAGCGGMEPIAEDGRSLEYQYFQSNYDRVEKAANARCARQGLEAKLEISDCRTVPTSWDPSSCLATATCEYCQSTFSCIDRKAE